VQLNGDCGVSGMTMSVPWGMAIDFDLLGFFQTGNLIATK
jgi:hypothetical protein